jgi:hypothetical protein
MSKKEQLPTGITQDQINDAKAKWGDDKVKIALLPIDDKSSESIGVLVKIPDRRIIGEFEKWIDKNPTKAKEILVKNSVLTRVDEVMADDGLFFAAVDAVAELMPLRKATIKNC